VPAKVHRAREGQGPVLQGLGEALGFAVNEIVHHNGVSGGGSQDAIPTGNPHQKDAFACIKPDPQEREAAAIRGPWQHSLAEEQGTIDVEILDTRAIATIDVGEDRAKPVDRGRHGGARHKEVNICDVTVYSGEKPLGTEGTEELGKLVVDAAKSDRGIRRVHAIGAHPESRPRGEEDRATRRVGVKEVGREIVRVCEGVWHAVPVDLSAAIGECAPYPIVGP